MPQRRTNAQITALLVAKIAQQVQRGANKGLDAFRVFITSRVREAVSVPAPRKAVRGTPAPGKKKGAILYYRATTRAQQGAPPRKLSGKLRQSVWSKMLNPRSAVIGANARGFPTRKNPRGANYPAILELTTDARRRHAFIAPTIKKFSREARSFLGQGLRYSVGA